MKPQINSAFTSSELVSRLPRPATDSRLTRRRRPIRTGNTRRLTVLALAAAVAATTLTMSLAATSGAAETAKLKVVFSPNRPKVSTTVSFHTAINTNDGKLPEPLTRLDLHMPAGMELMESQLGMATCSANVLLERGVAGCPADSRMGFGSTNVKFAFGPVINEAHAQITALLGNIPGEGIPILIYAEVLTPVSAAFVFPSRLLGDSRPYGQQLDIPLPLIKTLPGAPDVQITSLSASFGSSHLTYYRRIHGRTTAFKPRGIAVPRQCPLGGFPVAADLSFLDNTSVRARSKVPCPR
jgi:hypothetical protein